MRKLLVGTLAAGMMLTFAQPCWACSCAIVPPREYAASADAIFTGRVITTEAASVQHRVLRANFEVELAYKGSVAGRVSVETPADSAGCGFAFAEGRRYTVFAFLEPDGDLTTNLCSGSLEGGIQAGPYGLGSGAPPPDHEGPLAPSGEENAWAIALVAGAASVVALLLILVVRRRRQRLS